MHQAIPDRSTRQDTRGQQDESLEQTLTRVRGHLIDNPRDIDVLVKAGGILWKMGEYGEAVAHLQKALRCTETLISETDRRLADGAAGEEDQSSRILKRLGDCYAGRGDCQRAARSYYAAAALAPGDPEPYLGLGVLGLQVNQLDAAEQCFEMARDLRPDCGEAYNALGMIHQHRGDYESAFWMYLKSLELDCDNLVALLGLFQVSCQRGSFAEIVRYLETYLDKHPGDTSVLFCLATLYAREGKFAQARQAALKVLDDHPDKKEVVELLSQLEENSSP